MDNSTIDKLNIGCGLDYREGFINIDGNPDLPRVDYVLEIKPGVLLDYFKQESFNYILIKDFLEHNFHWEACSLLKDFHALLRSEGQLDIILPNVKRIINDLTKKVTEKVLWLYGGQDTQQSHASNAYELSRKKYPQYYCHKYGWTPESIESELLLAGFSPGKITDYGWNMRIVAQKKVKTFS